MYYMQGNHVNSGHMLCFCFPAKIVDFDKKKKNNNTIRKAEII